MAADLCGFDLQDMTHGYESKFIDCISKDILIKLCDGPLHVGENLVGIDFHFDKLNLSRFVGSHKVNMIGICGISGIGKTTLAKAIYNLMYIHFEGSCFCDDVQGVEKRQGITQVQMQMIGKVLKREDLKISSVAEGTMVIKKRMVCKRILLVLDDVNNFEQLEALAGSPDWFFPGSLIIFTGKDKQLLRSHKVDEIYEMGNLDHYNALELFSLYAFGKIESTEDFKKLASQVIIHLQGHPLGLKVIGRLLYGKSVYVWKSELHRLQAYPNSDILRKLRPSFDVLASDQKRIFLDIAWSFIGENRDFSASVLDSNNCSANANIEVLADKFLITVSPNDMSLQMHDLIQSMAREITREEFNMPGNRSRLWISSDFYDASNKNKVTEDVEVLVLLLKNDGQNIPVDGKAFTQMKNLRILKIYFPQNEKHLQSFPVKFTGSLDFLSNEIRFFCWHGCPYKYLPSDFYPENIVAIDLSYSLIKQLWATPKSFRRLRVMKLRYCSNLTTTPDLSEITNLEEVDLEGCVNLVSVHPSIGMLKRLVVLNLKDCKRLQNFPSRLEMDALKVLSLTGCLKVDQLPEALGRIKSLTEFHVDRTAIAELPSFVSSLINLESFSFGGQGRIQPRWWTFVTGPFGLLSKQQHPQRPISLAGLHMLKDLNLSYCNLLQVPDGIGGLSCLNSLNFSYCNLEQVPESIGGLSCLKVLNLTGNNFNSLPGSLCQIHYLQQLRLDCCKNLEALPELPPRLQSISACSCPSLREVVGSSKYFRYRKNVFRNCPKLFKNVTIDSEGSISKTDECLESSITSQGSIHRLSAFLGYLGFESNKFEFQFFSSNIDYYNMLYHGNSMPEWFTNRSTENHVKVELPSDWCYDKFRGYGTCVVFKCKKPFSIFEEYSVKNFDGASLTTREYFSRVSKDILKVEVIGIHKSDIILLQYTRDIKEWKKAKNFVTFCFEENNEDVEVKECGARLICDGDLQQDVTKLGIFQNLSTLSQHGGAMRFSGPFGFSTWSW